jgi:branched-chain amino acid transport system substrate-binding protein
MIRPWAIGLMLAVAVAGGYAAWRAGRRLADAVARRRGGASPAGSGAPDGAPAGTSASAPPSAPALLKRAEAAVARLRRQTESPKDPALRAQLADVDDQAAGVLADLRRFAGQVSALDKSLADIPVERLRRELAATRDEVAAATEAPLQTELEHAERSLTDQLAVADRLATARRTLLARMEAAALDLEGLGMRVSELIVLHDAVGDDAQTGDRLAEVTGDVEGMRAGLAEARQISGRVLGLPEPAAGTAEPAAGSEEDAADAKPVEPPATTRIEHHKPAKHPQSADPPAVTKTKARRKAKGAAGRGRPRWDIVAGAVAVVLVLGCLVNEFAPHAGVDLGAAVGGSGCVEALGFMGRLSGDDAGDGQTEFDAATLAVEQDNAAHPACRVQLQKYDTNAGDDGGKTAAETLAADPGVLGVVGPTYAGDVEDAMPALDADDIAAITPSASDTYLARSGWKVFHRTIPTDDAQADAAARYLAGTAKSRHTFVVADDSTFGTAVAPRVAAQLAAHKVGLAGRASVKDDQTDFAGVARQVAGSGADAVYFAGLGADAGGFLKALRAIDARLLMVGGDRIITTSFFTAAGAASKGTVAVCPCVPTAQGVDTFRGQFLARFGAAPGFYAPEAYDAARILLAGVRAGRTTRADLLDWVDHYDGDGVSRHLSFTAGGDIAGPRLNVWAYTADTEAFSSDRVIA